MTSEGSSARAWPPWVALAIVLVLYAWLQVLPLLRPGASHQNDFKHLYIGAQLLGRGENPYDADLVRETAHLYAADDPRFASILPFVYLPFTGIVMAPLGWMSFQAASTTWMILNHLFLIAGIALGAKAAGWPWRWSTVALLGAAVAFNYSVFRQNNAGQMNMALFFGMALLYFGCVRGWKAPALGLIAAFLMLFKITPGVFLVWFLLTRRWREAAWMVGWALGLTLVSVGIVGFGTHLAFLPVLADMGYGKSTWAEYGNTFWRDPYNQSVNAFFHHALAPWNGFVSWLDAGSRAANAATWCVTAAILVSFAWCCLRRHREAAGETVFGTRDSLTFALAVLVGLLAPSICWDHYLVQALLPAMILWQAAKGSRGCGLVRGSIVVAFVVFSAGIEFAGGGIHPGVIPIAGWWGPPKAIPGWGSAAQPVLMSLKLWPLLALFGATVWASLAGTRKTPTSE